MKKSTRIANAEAARILLISARELHDAAFYKLREAYPDEFSDNMTPTDVNLLNLLYFSVEQLDKEGVL